MNTSTEWALAHSRVGAIGIVMQYEVYGPFWSPRVHSEAAGKSLRAFWDDIEDAVPGLARAIGIYVFSTRHGEFYTPWYVGKTNARAGFRGEIFQEHKLSHYVSAGELKRGAPAIHLIAKVQPVRGEFPRQSEELRRQQLHP